MATTLLNPILSAGTLIGDAVKNPQGENLGHIKEIMFDTGSGRIAYAVLTFGGFLGLGNKLFAIPWRKLQVNTDDKCLILDVKKEVLENAEGFDQENWPNFADPDWATRTHSHYDVAPYWD